MKQILNSTRPFTAILLWGILGSIGLILIAGKAHNAETVIPVFGFALILSILTVKLNRPNKIFLDLFTTTLLTFTLMFLIDYIFIMKVVNPGILEITFFGHIWRIAVVISIGAVTSLLLSYIATLLRKSN